MDEIDQALRENRLVKVRPVAKRADVTASHLYQELRRDPSGVVKIGNAIRLTPRRARRILGLEDEQAAS